jgi:TonB-dependent SusC/RagA subfamily outer membrane receptor
MAFKRFISGLLLVIGAFSVYSFVNIADDPLNKIRQQLEKWTDDRPVEKVYLHLDKPYYTAGEDIWLKAYVTIGTEHKLSAYSTILNVELIDERDSIKQAIKLQLTAGTASGDFALPDTLHEGNYRIRAYTNYMRNAGSEYFFDKAISIGNVITNRVFTNTTFNYQPQNGNTISSVINYTDANGAAYAGNTVNYSVILNSTVVENGKGITDGEGNLHISFPGNDPALLRSGKIVTALTLQGKNVVNKTIPIRAMAGKADVQFFPEGGNLVNGLSSKIAFKAIGADGLGIDIKGTVIDKNGRDVAVINSTHLGMGVFNLVPLAGNIYRAKIIYADGSEGTVALPAATDKGCVLNIADTDPQRLKISISTASGNTNQDSQQPLSLVAQSGGKIYYAAKSQPGSAVFTSVIPKSKFPSGIVQFTLFSAKGEPLNERLVFIQNRDQLNLVVSAEKTSYSPRQRVNLNIEARNKDGKPATGSFSVAVTDETKVPVDENSENNIMANLLLTSDLKGYVEKPAYYFNNVNDKTRADLDVLMLTQGYRRFEWKEILNNDPAPVIFQPEKAFTISGTVTTPNGKPVPRGKVELLNLQDGVFKIDTLTDGRGRFSFKDLIFEDSVIFLVQARTAKNKKDVVIKLDSIAPPINLDKNTADFKVNVSSGIAAYARNSKQLYAEQLKYGLGNHVITLKEVQIKAKRDALKHSANLNGPGNADQILLAKDFINYGCVQIGDCLQGRLLGVIFRNGIPFTTRGGGAMQIIIDGMYSDAYMMNSLNVNDIQSIEVLRSVSYASIYGGRAGNGVLVITTKRGDEPVDVRQYYGSGVKVYRPIGFHKARTFYSPQYGAPKVSEKIADLRTTIFWKPDILTDTTGKAAISYFNAGSKGTYRVVIEGIDGNGNLGRQVYRYKVE